jgi:NAD(P)-dependent dehydrogenase (short-subunit alcohol dehydrogenase family)
MVEEKKKNDKGGRDDKKKKKLSHVARQTQTPFQGILILFTLILSIALQYPQPKLDLNYYSELATNYTSSSTTGTGTGTTTVISKSNHDQPLHGITVVITGPTSGLGKGLTKKLYSLGATIIGVGRSPTKLAKLSEELGEDVDGVDGGEKKKRLIPIVADFSNLDSVASAGNEIVKKFKKIDFLVNNAGIAQASTGAATPQGYDLIFGVNYLAPFLFTEKLLPALEKSSMVQSSRIIQVSSSMHLLTDGSSLIPRKPSSSSSLSAPPASEIDTFLHDIAAYGTSKLAQIYHARSLTRELTQKNKSSKIQIVSLCPSWVATHIVGSFMKNILQLFAFDADGYGIAPILFAMFHPHVGVNDNDFVGSCSIMCMTNNFIKWTTQSLSTYGMDTVRQTVMPVFGWVFLIFQKFFASVDFRESSTESHDIKIQDALYEWSKKEISPWI